jgi:hypothetical protein
VSLIFKSRLLTLASGLVAQFVSSNETSAKWTARTPPKRQVEGSNPSEPETIQYEDSVIQTNMPNTPHSLDQIHRHLHIGIT